jgi:hypothetical protein
MRARGCRQRGSKQRAYRRAARSAACLASGHMIVWPRHSARVTRTPAATRASRGHMIMWPTSSRLVIVWPTSSRPRRAGTAATHVWRCAPRVATWSCGHVKPRHARRRRVVSPPRAARATQDAQGRQVERPGASAPQSAAVAGAPWSTRCWPARVRPAERAGGLVGGRRAGEPARGRAATAARSARVPMSRVPMSLAPSARTSEHRPYSPDQGALRGLPAGDRAHTGRCGQTNGKAIGTLPRDASLPAARGPFRRRGAVTTEPRRPGGPRGYQDGVRRRPAASKRPTLAEYRRQASAPTQFPGDRGLRAPHVYQPRAGHHAPPAAPWQPCSDADTAAANREHRRPDREYPPISTRSSAVIPPRPGTAKSPCNTATPRPSAVSRCTGNSAADRNQ